MQQAGGGAAATRAQPYSIYQLQLHGCALLPCCSQKVPRHRQPGKAAANHCHTLRCCLLGVGGGGSGGGSAVQPSWADCVPAQHEWGFGYHVWGLCKQRATQEGEAHLHSALQAWPAHPA